MDATYGPLAEGPGGVHLVASPGPLTVELWRTVVDQGPGAGRLQVLLTTPDRRVVDRGEIPAGTSTAAPGTDRTAPLRLETTVTRPGPYFLAVVAPGDRYGDRFAWTVRTNCDRYLRETARGHEDRPHTEPIRVRGDEPAEICFLPVDRAFEATVEGLPADGAAPELRAADGRTIDRLEPDDGVARTSVPAGARSACPWRIRLPDGEGTVHVDGLTRWRDEDPYRNLCLWTDDPDRWVPYHPYRWLLRPRRYTRYGPPGERDRHPLLIHAGPDAGPVELAIEDATDGAASLETDAVSPPARTTVELAYDVPPRGEERTVRVRARAPTDAFDTYATVRIRGGTPPAATTVPLPIVLEPYRHENAQFGDVPDYPTDWELYVDPSNRPVTRTDDGLAALHDGRWTHATFPAAVTPATDGVPTGPYPTTRSNTKIGFDDDGDRYLVGTTAAGAALLHASDRGMRFTAYDLGRTGAFDIETAPGTGSTAGPPGIVRAFRTEDDPDHKWRQLAELAFIPVTKRDGAPVIGEPVRLTDRALGVGAHSGLPNAIASRDGRTHVIWGEATDPDTDVPGVPTYVGTVDRERGTLIGEPTLVGYGPPANDVHNRPSLVLDGDGYLHALTGTHGAPFRYARSLAPNDAGEFTDPVDVTPGRGTYIGLVCDAADVLHLVYRLWRTDEPPHPGATHAVLAYQRKEPGRPWSDPRPLVTAALPDYSIFYHRLTIDRHDRLLCSYDYWSTYWGYRNDQPEKQGHHRTTLVSADGGESWRFLRTADFREC